MERQLSTAQNAVLVPSGPDAGLTWHFGDPLREQRVLATGAGVILRDNRDVLTVTGPERLPWLHSITSQHLTDLKDGQSMQGLVLSPNGHVEQHWWLTELAGTTWLDTEPGQGPAVLGYLQKMIFMKRVEPADVSADWAVLTVAGPLAAQVPKSITGAGFVRPRDEQTFDLIVPRAESGEYLDRLVAGGAEPVGTWAYEARRVERREPRFGFETDHRTLAHEVGWIGSAVHLNKGCYRGQETVARVQNLGKPPRRLVLLHLSGESDEPPAVGTEVQLEGRTVGFVGTAVQHYELGPVALAVIKRTLPDDTTLTVAGGSASID